MNAVLEPLISPFPGDGAAMAMHHQGSCCSTQYSFYPLEEGTLPALCTRSTLQMNPFAMLQIWGNNSQSKEELNVSEL